MDDIHKIDLDHTYRTPVFYKGKIFRNGSGCRFKYKLSMWWDDLKSAWQRAKNGYDHNTVWNLKYAFIQVMPHILQDLYNNHVAYPGGAICTNEQWERILQEMIYNFQQADPDLCQQVNEYEDTFNITITDDNELDEDGFYKAKVIVDNEENWNKYKEREQQIENYRQKHLRKALRLFCEYFNYLWD